jgi:hypothetical protein
MVWNTYPIALMEAASFLFFLKQKDIANSRNKLLEK